MLNPRKIGLALLLSFLATAASIAPSGADSFDLILPEVPSVGGHEALSGAIRKAARNRKERNERIAYEREHWFELAKTTRFGNRLELLPTGEESVRARKAVIASAQHSIYISAYAFKADKYTKGILELLCAKQAKGVDVRIIGDNIGSWRLRSFEHIYNNKTCKIPVMFYNKLDRGGLNRILYSMHEKLLIADGERMVMGGAGWDNGYAKFGSHIDDWWDLDISVDGPAACQFHREFVSMWKSIVDWYLPLRYTEEWRENHRSMIGADKMADCEEKILGHSNALPIYSHPLFNNGAHPILDAYFQAIAASKSEITLYAPYFMPREDFMEALIAAKNQGVRVRILTNSSQSNDEEFSLVAAFALSRKLVEAGVEIYLWPHKGTLHRKAIVFDRRWASVGSDNFNGRGQKWNSENVIMTDDNSIAQQLATMLDEDLQGLKPLTIQQLEENFDDLSWKARKLFPLLRPFMQGPARD